MKLTLDIDDSVIARLEREAMRGGRSMSELVETALRRLLGPPPKDPPATSVLPTFRGGGTFVDIANREALDRAMESR